LEQVRSTSLQTRTNDGPQTIRFDDGAAYERMMGAGAAPPVKSFWMAGTASRPERDRVGCGNGAFTDLVVNKNRAGRNPSVDPSDGPTGLRPATRRGIEDGGFHKGDAMALPFAD